MKISSTCRLYGLLDTGYVSPDEAVAKTHLLLAAGVQILQLRAKTLPIASIKNLAREILPVCRKAEVPFIINDYPEIAAEIDADGAHVGQEGISVAEMRSILGPGKIVGKSSHSLSQLLATAEESPDYLGFGPIFATPTKPEYIPIGSAEIAEANARCALPVFCIGGIKRENLPQLIAAGARRVAIVSGLLQAPDVQQYGHTCRALLDAVEAPH